MHSLREGCSARQSRQEQRKTACGLRALLRRGSLGQVYKAGALTVEKLKGAEVSWRDVFDEIPISISNRWAVGRYHICHELGFDDLVKLSSNRWAVCRYHHVLVRHLPEVHSTSVAFM